MPPYKKSCGSVSSYVSIEHSEVGEDSFEVKLLSGVHELVIPTSTNLKNPSILATGRGVSYDNLMAFELIEFEKWHKFMKVVNRNPELCEMPYPGEKSPAFAPNALGRFIPSSVGNLLLHEVCQNNPPLEVVMCLLHAYPKATLTPGHGGLLPLHLACCSGASFVVVSALLKAQPTTIKSTCHVQNALMLPLHLACRHAAHRDVLETLLSYYPEASAIRDGHGQLPIEYAHAIISPFTRHEALKCLEHGERMRVTANATTALLEAEHADRKVGMESEYEVFITAMKNKYDKEIGDLNCEMLDLEFEKTNLTEELESTKQEMDRIMETFSAYKVEQQDKFMKMQESLRLGSVESVANHDAELAKLNETIKELNDTITELKADSTTKTEEIERLEAHSREQEERFTALMDAEHLHFNEVYAEQQKKEEELSKKVMALEKANAMKCRLLNKLAILGHAERQRQAERIVELVVRLGGKEEEQKV